MKEPAQQPEEIDPESARVDLGPILGIPPTIYVPVIYILAGLFVLFLLLVLPGIRNHGTQITFVTVPGQTSVRVDGARLGTAPGTHFVRSGQREIEVARPGFVSDVQTVDVGGRRFASLIFPRRQTIRIHLDNADADELIASAAAELSQWSLLGEASGQYQFPPIARNLASDLAAVGSDDATELYRFMTAMAPEAGSQALINDLGSAALAGASPAPIATPAGVASLVQWVSALDAQTPGLALQAVQVLGANGIGAQIDGGPWYVDSAERFAFSRRALGNSIAIVPGTLVTYPLGLSFVRVAGSILSDGSTMAARGGDVPRVFSANTVVGTTEVPVSAFATFLEANPSWADAQSVRDQGLGDEGYLAEIDALLSEPDLPMSGVSFDAASAFADWYSSLLPAGLTARLPTEDEWDAARLASDSDEAAFAGASGPEPAVPAGEEIVGIVGNVWEWTADWYAPFSYLYESPPEYGAHRVVRGGGYATERRGFDPADRGSLEPSWASPFVGFRLVIEEASE